MPLDVTRATLADLDDLVPLFDAYRRFYGKAPDASSARAFLRERIESGESVVFLARADGVPAGFTQLYPLFSSTRVARLWLLNDLFVDDGMRGRGVGSVLLARAREHALETGACELMLETAVDNPARRLYERHGYRSDDGYVVYKLAP